MNELEIIQGLKAANQRCFEIVYNEYYRPLVFFAHTHVQDGAVAHDITIDAFTKLWDRRGDFDSLQKIKAFYISLFVMRALTISSNWNGEMRRIRKYCISQKKTVII